MPFIEVERGVKVFAEDLNLSGKKTVFLIHGWPVDHRMYEYQLDILPKHGYRCVAIDVRGFGYSDSPWTGYSLDRLADDVHTVIDKMDLHDITLVGFSMGGAISVRYMARYSGWRVSKLVLLSAAAPQFTRSASFPYGSTKEQIDELIRTAYKNRPKMLTGFGKTFFGAPVTPSFRAWFQSLGLDASGHGTIRALESLRDEMLWDDLPHIKVPTGIFRGLLDKVVAPQCGMALHQGIKGSELFSFKHSGHAVFYDQLDLFNQRFLEYLGR